MSDILVFPLTEKELSNYSIDTPPLIPLHRNIEIQTKYDTFRSNPENLQTFIDTIKENIKSNKNKYYMCKNDFPYYTINSISHYVLWVDNDLKLDKVIINTLIKEHFDIKQYELITYWINIEENRSIHSLNHIQLFVKKLN
jgi:hypothetical protein|tara:strand:+ start:145 stop:567 length:423 start_codon:yes stop_codon:yes gene_type:complete